MKKIFTILLLMTAFMSGFAQTRVIVMSDIGGSDPDDTQSLVHLLVTLDQIELEGFISQHAWVPYGQGAIGLINGIIDRYESVQSNLMVHSKDFPAADYLRSIVKEGQKEAAMKGTGKGKDSDGSEWIIKVVDEDDPRPVWISAWSGMNTLAQALIKIRDTRTPEELEQFISKIRVYDVLGQDDAGAWIVKNFPDLIYIRNKEIYGWAPDDEWTRQNVQNVGPLGQVYPNRIWATEGDSPSFFYCFDNGRRHFVIVCHLMYGVLESHSFIDGLCRPSVVYRYDDAGHCNGCLPVPSVCLSPLSEETFVVCRIEDAFHRFEYRP